MTRSAVLAAIAVALVRRAFFGQAAEETAS
jgi:hypothetical protein